MHLWLDNNYPIFNVQWERKDLWGVFQISWRSDALNTSFWVSTTWVPVDHCVQKYPVSRPQSGPINGPWIIGGKPGKCSGLIRKLFELPELSYMLYHEHSSEEWWGWMQYSWSIDCQWVVDARGRWILRTQWGTVWFGNPPSLFRNHSVFRLCRVVVNGFIFQEVSNRA